MTRRQEGLLERTEMKMMWWMLGDWLKDKKRNEVIRKFLGVACITDRLQGHVMRRKDEVV